MDEARRGSLERWAPWGLAGTAVVLGLIAAADRAWWTVLAMTALAVLAFASRAELRRRAHRTAPGGD